MCSIGAFGAAAVAAALPAATSLTDLNLASNDMGDQGAAALAAALPGCRLRKLSVRKNGLTADGARAFAEALPQVSSSSQSAFRQSLKFGRCH